MVMVQAARILAVPEFFDSGAGNFLQDCTVSISSSYSVHTWYLCVNKVNNLQT